MTIAVFLSLTLLWLLPPDFGSSTTALAMNKQTIKQHTSGGPNTAGNEAAAEAVLNGASDDASSVSDHAVLRDNLRQVPQKILITDSYGNLIDAHITVLEHDSDFEQHFYETGTAGDSMWGNWVLFDCYSEEKAINLSPGWVPVKTDKIILLVEAEGYLSEIKFIKLSELGQAPITILLFVAAPITVKIVSAEGAPLSNVSVTRYGVRGATVSGNGSFEDQFKAKALTNSELTDSSGELVFKSVEQLNHLVVEGNGEYSSAQKYAVVPGQAVSFTLTETFTVSGYVYDADGNPLAGIGVGAYLGYGAPDRNIQSVATDATGYYEMLSLTATASNIEVLTYAADRVSQVHALSFPQIGESYEIDFKVPVGVGGHYKFVTSWGEPLAGVGVGFLKKEHDWVAYQYETKDDGTVDCKKAFDPNLKYFLNLVLSGIQIRPGIELIPGGEQEIAVDGLARIADIEWKNLPQDLQPTTYLFMSKNSNATSVASWLAKNGMPMLPAGAGTLDVIWPNEIKQSYNIVLEERRDNTLHLDYESSRLLFELPKGVNASIKLTSESGFTVFSQRGASDHVEASCMPGVYNLSLKIGSVITTIPDIQIGKGDLNIGEVALSNTAAVYGTLQDEGGVPWRGADVFITTMLGVTLGETATDDEGNFFIDGLPAGNSRIMVMPSLSLGRVGSTMVQNINLVEGEQVGPLELQMTSGEYLRVNFSPWGLPLSRGFCLSNGVVSYNEVSSEEYFQVSSPRQDALVGAGAGATGKAWWFATQVLAGETQATVSRNCERKRYTFLDAQQHPLAGAVVKFELRKTFLPGTSTTDANGVLELEHSSGMDLEMIAMLPGGFSQRWSVLQTPGGALTTAAAEDMFVWNIYGSGGKPIAGAICLQQGYGGLRSNVFGEVSLPSSLAMSEFVVSAPRHVALLASPKNTGRLVLPRASNVKTIVAASEGIAMLSYEPIVGDLRFARDLRHRLRFSDDNKWALATVPVGPAIIKGYHEDGTVAWAKEVMIPWGEQTELILD